MLVADLVSREPTQDTSTPSPLSDLTAHFESGQIVDHISFRPDSVRTELNANPEDLILITAAGDAMDPTIRSGDLVSVHRISKVVKKTPFTALQRMTICV